MKKTLFVCFVLALGTVRAQNPFSSSATPRFNSIRMNLEEAAEAMPADRFSFKLTEAQMTFGEWMIHSANSNYGSCSTIRGQERPVPGWDARTPGDKAHVDPGRVGQANRDQCEMRIIGDPAVRSDDKSIPVNFRRYLP